MDRMGVDAAQVARLSTDQKHILAYLIYFS